MENHLIAIFEFSMSLPVKKSLASRKSRSKAGMLFNFSHHAAVGEADQSIFDREIQYSEDEAKAVRCVTNEMHVYNPASWDQGIAEKLRLEGITSVSISPGRAPSVAAFVAEKKVSFLILASFVSQRMLIDLSQRLGCPRFRQDPFSPRSRLAVLLENFLQSRQDPNEVEQDWQQPPLPDAN